MESEAGGTLKSPGGREHHRPEVVSQYMKYFKVTGDPAAFAAHDPRAAWLKEGEIYRGEPVGKRSATIRVFSNDERAVMVRVPAHLLTRGTEEEWKAQGIDPPTY